MTFDVVTIFPEMFRSVLEASLLGKAQERGLLAVHLCDPRDFAPGKHRSTDDTPYGGGSGMVMRPEPLVSALEHVAALRGRGRRILLSAAGQPFDRQTAARLATEAHVVLVCGRYEGVDERVTAFIDEELSIGDYVLTGGELGAMVIIDAVARRLPGVLGNADSAVDESFEAGALEYPQYTRPPEFRGLTVPEVLLSGHHERVRRWRRQQALWRTRARRPDLYARLALSEEDKQLVEGAAP